MTDPKIHSPIEDPGREALADALRVSFRLLLWTMALIAVAYMLSGVFIVQEHQRAYVLVFGKVTGIGAERVKGPGLHWTWPKPIAEIVRVPAERIQSIEIDTLWFEETPGTAWEPGRRPTHPSLRPDRDGYVLTGDANIIHARWSLRYTVRDPEIFLFGVADAETILRKEMDRAATLVAQQWTVDRVLRRDIEGFRAAVDQILRDRLHLNPIGFQIHRLDLIAVTPPGQVAAAFEAVIEAEQERSRTISAARAHSARVANEAIGDAGRLASEAQADRQRTISVAEADADFFLAVLEAYTQTPAIIAQTLWQDRIRELMRRVDAQYLVHERRDGGQQELRLQLGPTGQR